MKQEIVIRFRERNVKAFPAGPSLYGNIYYSGEEGRYFRLLQREDIPKFSLRKEIEDCIGKPRRQGIAPIVDEGEAFVGSDSFYCVVYELGGLSFADIIAEPDNALVLACIAKVFTSLETVWGDEVKAGGFLMPADIVFHHYHPWLLSFPVEIDWPRYEALLEQPERILYLPPEIIRGNRHLVREKNRALYACGIMLIQGLFDIRLPSSPIALFKLASSGSFFDKSRHPFKLPYWIEKTESVTNVLAVINTGLSPDPRNRAGLNLTKSAGIIEALAVSLDPVHLALEMRTKKKFKEALDFIADVSIGEKNFRLLMLASDIAYKDLELPIEAIELYESAIAAAPAGDWSAQFTQLEILLKVAVLLETNALLGYFINKLDTMVWRDYIVLPKKIQETYVLGCAMYFARKKKHTYAQNAIHPHMYDGDTFLWWKFQYTIAYAEALLGEAVDNPLKISASKQFIDSVKAALSKIMSLPPEHPHRMSFSNEELQSYGDRITKMNSLMLDLSRNH